MQIIFDWQFASWHPKGGWIRGDNNTMPKLLDMLVGKLHRNYTSCGRFWYGLVLRPVFRINLFPISMWVYRQ